MVAVEGLVQGPANSWVGLVVVMATWSICSPWISLRRPRRRSSDDWVPLWRASRLVLSSRHFCQGERYQRCVRIELGKHPGTASPSLPQSLSSTS